MKISKVLLRWYKSFNINYLGYDDRREGIVDRPWNAIRLGDDKESYRFVEIPIGGDITTIVGANESGKSHLLSAINKVVKGTGIPDDRNESKFDVTDLCHYASVKDKNAEIWPNIGVEFSDCSAQEFNNVIDAAGNVKGVNGDRFTLVLTSEGEIRAWLFVEGHEPIKVSQSQLEAVRKHLTPVEFIRSDMPLPDEVVIDDILSELVEGRERRSSFYTFESAQKAARIIAQLPLLAAKTPVPDAVAGLISNGKESLLKREQPRNKTELERMLFCDILGIKPSTFERLANLPMSKRSYATGLTNIWNEELDEVLNLSYYWQQDDKFNLRIDYKDGVFYFEITDKTGSVYTFRERSSGLRYFLSYYIQAKALERKYRDSGCVVLMDEPDSFLSIAAQKNLLAVFESLVSVGSSCDNFQLVYTTHSPFCINQNFPNRIRLVRKGDAEEGTQFVDESRLRHYEPVRSALGIDCAQTLFMGETNVVLEGPSDQYLLAELNRQFAMHQDHTKYLDLNSIILMSAESAPGVAKLLSASQWGDERIPACVVMFDNDGEGHKQRDIITGQGKYKKLIEPEFVFLLSESIGEEIDSHAIVSTEDLVPKVIYSEAIKRYLLKWYPSEFESKKKEIQSALKSDDFGEKGLVEATNELFDTHVHPKRDFDKMGVFHLVVSYVEELFETDEKNKMLQELGNRLQKLCEFLMQKIDISRQASRKLSASQTVRREIDEFFKRFKTSAPAFDVVRLLNRIEREVKDIGDDGDNLRDVILKLQQEIEKTRQAGATKVEGGNWQQWSSALFRLKKNPLSPGFKELKDVPISDFFTKQTATNSPAPEQKVNEIAAVTQQAAQPTEEASSKKKTK